MGSTDIESREAALRHRVQHGFQQVANAGEHWFLSAVQAFGGLGAWARREAGLRPRGGQARGAQSEDQMSGEQLDVLTVGSIDATSMPASLEQRSTSRLATEPAGVLPLWRALGRVVAEHADSGYRSLSTDQRFWELVTLIQSLGGDCTKEARRAADAAAEPEGAQGESTQTVMG